MKRFRISCPIDGYKVYIVDCNNLIDQRCYLKRDLNAYLNINQMYAGVAYVK